MREIKFRALTNGFLTTLKEEKWVYGHYFVEAVHDEDSDGFDHISYIQSPYGDHYQQHEVRRDTVGQYTGLKDKNGVEIYEGDCYNRNDGRGIFCVDYNHGKFVLVRYGHRGMSPKPIGSKYNLENGEVIGNIYEHSNLCIRKP